MRLVVNIDGASRGNPGPAGIGVMIKEENGRLERELSKYIGEATNNVAEYEALLLALREVGSLKPAEVRILSDSELLVRQIEGTYRVKNPRLALLHSQAQDLIRTIPSFRIEHVGRELNLRADALANRGIDEALVGAPRDGG
ncbi:MAG: ribonuclease HI family protein [candidate division NC10 bacterium]|nr:ribonuclease HI family protein [candidate division NC10 bacterium]